MLARLSLLLTLLPLLLLGFAAGQTDPVDQGALIAFWNGLSSKGSVSWNTAESLCGQYGIYCSSTKVIRLNFYADGLQGTIATEIGLLTSLLSVFIKYNSLSGTIPTQIGSLVNLQLLYLQDNRLNGTIPTETAKLGNLSELELSGNRLSGPFPTEILKMASLQQINLNYNQLSGTLPTEIASMTGLKWLFIEGNSLSGTIPTEIGTIATLERIGLSGNSLSGTIPTQLGSLTNMLFLYLGGNGLSGTIPSQIGALTKLMTLSLYKCGLSGSIPIQIMALVGLSELFLYENHLTGTLPTQIGQLTKLKNLRLQQNSLHGTIPTELDAVSPDYLFLADNYFCPKADYRTWHSYLSDYTPDSACINGGNCTDSGCSCPGFSSPYCLEDVNECNISTPCHADATCNNIFGSFSCACNTGYSGDGFLCTDINECTLSNPCHADANCNNTIGSFNCICNAGYSGSGFDCQDVDECKLGMCNTHAACNNTAGSFNCTCLEGFLGDGIDCLDVDECAGGTHDCHQDASCTNTAGGFSCACLDGFSGTGRNCTAVCSTQAVGTITWPQTHVNTTAEAACNAPSYGIFQGTLANFTLLASRRCLPRNDSREAVWSAEVAPCESTCALQGCQNGGTCLYSDAFAFCACTSGFQGKFCEQGGAQRCPDIPCVHGECVNPHDVNLPGRCDCTGTGFNGSLCQIETDDCASQPCQNGGTCTDNGPNRFLCECPQGFHGLQCQLCREGVCQNGGRCAIVGKGAVACDCTGTGYEGALCAAPVEGDCRAIPCQNGGECQWSKGGEDAKECACPPGFRGAYCQAEEYRSLESENTVFFVLIPIVGLFLLIVAILSAANRKVIRDNKKAWFGLFGHVLFCCIGIFDLFTDCFFVIESYDLMVNQPSKGYFFFASLAFLGASWLASVLITVLMSLHWSGQVRLYVAAHPSSPTPHTRLPLGFFFAFALLSNDGIGIFHIATKYLFLEQGFQLGVSSFAPYLLGFFFSKAFLEDLPQLVVQGLYQSQIGRASPVIVFSLANSAISLFFGVVLFIFSEDFGGVRHWIRTRGEARLMTPTQGGRGIPLSESALELSSSFAQTAPGQAPESVERGGQHEKGAGSPPEPTVY